MNSNDGVIISCGLLLPPNQANLAIHYSNLVNKKSPSKINLNSTTQPPYLKLYETVFPTYNLDKVVKTIKKISKEMVPLPIKWEGIEVTDKLVVLWGENNKPLDLLQQAILLELNKLREGYFKQKYLRQKFYSTEEKESFEKWGSPWAKSYIPHLVLAKAKTKFQLFNVDFEWEYKHCVFDEIFVGVKTSDGNFKPRHTFKFKKI